VASVNLWTSAEHALDYLRRADSIPHRVEGESTLLEFVPRSAARVLDVGSGDGRLLALVRVDRPSAHFTALDFSPAMLASLRDRFASDPSITIVDHNLDEPLPAVGKFDAVISSFAIHHLSHHRKHGLYQEIFEALEPGGVFCNLEHVASPTAALHSEWLQAIGITPEDDDPSNNLLGLGTQLQWLRDLGFKDVDCHWKWRELALLAGTKPV
jgi:tRNA (cmo5U34)-methyltransferase